MQRTCLPQWPLAALHVAPLSRLYTLSARTLLPPCAAFRSLKSHAVCKAWRRALHGLPVECLELWACDSRAKCAWALELQPEAQECGCTAWAVGKKMAGSRPTPGWRRCSSPSAGRWDCLAARAPGRGSLGRAATCVHAAPRRPAPPCWPLPVQPPCATPGQPPPASHVLELPACPPVLALRALALLGFDISPPLLLPHPAACTALRDLSLCCNTNSDGWLELGG